MCSCACGSSGLMLEVFLNHFPLCSLGKGPQLDWELIDMATLARQFALGILSLPLSTGISSGLLRTVSIWMLGFWTPSLLTLSKQAWFICGDIASAPKAQVIIIQSISFCKYIHHVTEGKSCRLCLQNPFLLILFHLHQSARELATCFQSPRYFCLSQKPNKYLTQVELLGVIHFLK